MVPATIDDPVILDEITNLLKEIGYAGKKDLGERFDGYFEAEWPALSGPGT